MRKRPSSVVIIGPNQNAAPLLVHLSQVAVRRGAPRHFRHCRLCRPAAAGDGGSRRSFARAAAVALAHGKRDEAEQLATARGASDPAAAVVLAQLLAARGKYREAQALLEPLVAREPTGDAALELALLYRTIGRSGDAQPILTAIYPARRDRRPIRTSSSGPARAAHALNRPRDANILYRDAERAGGDPAVVEPRGDGSSSKSTTGPKR